jgi:hypothetical protein
MNGGAPHFLRPPPLPIRSRLPRSLALSAAHPELPDVKDLLAARGLGIRNEIFRRWALKFGPAVARILRNIQMAIGQIPALAIH